MLNNQHISVKEAVHTLQLHLLDGITSENHLLAAGSLFSRDDYRDVVIERTIDNNCGYPLCGNVLPHSRNRKGRFRISLKEHKVYDLKETYLYCSSGCLVNSSAFAAVLKDERCYSASESKLNEILSLFLDSNPSTDKIVVRNDDIQFSELRVHENVDGKHGQVSLHNWMGPSNAVEGYVPVRDNAVKSPHNNGSRKGHFNDGEKLVYNVGSQSSVVRECDLNIPNSESEETKGKSTTDRGTPGSVSTSISFLHGDVIPTDFSLNEGDKTEKYVKEVCPPVEPIPKSAIKLDRAGKQKRVVTWADEKTDIVNGKGITDIQHVETTRVMSDIVEKVDEEGGIQALTLAAADISSEVSDLTDAAVEAGVGILPQKHIHNSSNDFEEKPISIKWPKKAGVLTDNLLNYEDSWLDEPPDGFRLSLSTFSMMWNALYEWITLSSLAHIYGRDESHIEEFLRIKGREYTHKVILSDGRSPEIKQMLSGCLSRALPELVTNLKLPIPISSLEHSLRDVLETMSFMWPIPPLRVKQWQIMNLLLIEGLSVYRIPWLSSHMMTALFHKVVEGADVSSEEYEAMRDVVLPLGRRI